jgi:ketosteroid isomerase-like protein
VRKCETAELSIHSILEKLAVLTDDGPQQVWVVATLIFGKTALGWRLMARHASAGTTEVVEVGPAAALLH